MSEFALVGDKLDTIKHPPVFELRLRDHIPTIDPTDFGYTTDNVENLRPLDYFVTSGDAVEKAKKLEKDLWSLAHRVKANRKKKPTKKYLRYEKAVWGAAGKARTLVRKLKEARSDSCFLETEWRDRRLIVIPKNPRSRK